MYYDEDLLLDLRLNFLDKFVKKFVISEATYTHNGNKKKLKFDINNYRKFKDKINYIVVDEQPNNILKFVENEPKHKRGEKLILNGMARDYFQRENLRKGLTDLSGEDLVLISDLDEIPNPYAIKSFGNNSRIGCFVQKNFLYKLNLINIDEPSWYGTRICRKKDLKSPQWLREIKAVKRPFYKFYKPKFDLFIPDGGWHFSSVKSIKGIFNKLNSFAEQQYNNPNYKNLDLIEKKIQNKEDLFDRKYNYKVIAIDKSFPEFLYNNKEKYKEFIYIK